MTTARTTSGLSAGRMIATAAAAPRHREEVSAGAATTTLVLTDWRQLATHAAAWEELASHAVEANVFYEPWMLLPALQAFGAGSDLRFVLVLSADRLVLCGLFPFECRPHYRGLPLGYWRTWTHEHCYLATPLVRAGWERPCLDAVFACLAEARPGCSLVEFRGMPANGLFAQALDDRCADRALPTWRADRFTRGLLRVMPSAEEYLRQAMSAGQRKSRERELRRLAELGHLECVVLQPDGDVAAWLDEFLHLECSGWKGRSGSALACTPAGRSFFLAVAAEAFRRGRLLMQAIRLNGRPLAMRCSFTAGQGAFSFKAAYDEDYAHYSPGVLMELENIRLLHARPQLRWMDSCTAPGNELINHLWRDRRPIESLLVPTGRPGGDLAVSLLPLLRWISVRLKRCRQ